MSDDVQRYCPLHGVLTTGLDAVAGVSGAWCPECEKIEAMGREVQAERARIVAWLRTKAGAEAERARIVEHLRHFAICAGKDAAALLSDLADFFERGEHG